MEITKKWLEENRACSEGVTWFSKQKETSLGKVVLKLVNKGHPSWANWTIVRFMSQKQKVQYAVYAAEQVIEIYEKKYPKDERPRKAIEAAKKWIDNPSADAAAYAAAKKKMQIKILEYGLKILNEGEK